MHASGGASSVHRAYPWKLGPGASPGPQTFHSLGSFQFQHSMHARSWELNCRPFTLFSASRRLALKPLDHLEEFFPHALGSFPAVGRRILYLLSRLRHLFFGLLSIGSAYRLERSSFQSLNFPARGSPPVTLLATRLKCFRTSASFSRYPRLSKLVESHTVGLKFVDHGKRAIIRDTSPQLKSMAWA